MRMILSDMKILTKSFSYLKFLCAFTLGWVVLGLLSIGADNTSADQAGFNITPTAHADDPSCAWESGANCDGGGGACGSCGGY
jgi:hypothetical protein